MHETDREAVEAEGLYRDMLAPLNEVERTLKQYSNVIDDDDALALRETAESLREDGRELLDDGRLLRLGVIGQVNAGKSSLLNALLFDGEEVLPRAATPMTASLTHILKSDRDEIEIEYYSESDWDEIVRHSKQYRRELGEHEAQESKAGGGATPTPEPALFLRASHELVEMARDKGLKVEDYHGRKDRYDTSIDKLNEMLPRLVGAEGELTPLVKSVTIRCSQGMPEMDIVDTPGVNDPIVSRSRETRKFLGRCDAVLLLSYSGQFMDSEDATFFLGRVRAAGIARKVLLASKFDSALIDVSIDHNGDLQKALDDTRDRLAEHAMDALRRTSRDSDIGVSKEEVLFVSPMCTALARRPFSEWSTDEEEVFENLRRAYPGWLNLVDGEVGEETKVTLSEIGNRDGVDRCLSAIRSDKNSILERKVRDFLDQKRRDVETSLRELTEDLSGQRNDLNNGTISDANERVGSLERMMEDIKEDVRDRWEDLVLDQWRLLDEASKNINSEAKEARENITGAVSKECRTERKNMSGVLPWFARILGLGGREPRTYEERVENETKIRDAVDEFTEALSERLEQAVRGMFQTKFRDRAKREMNTIVASRVSNEVASTLDADAMKRSIRRAVDQVRKSTAKNLELVRKELKKEFDDVAEWEVAKSGNISEDGSLAEKAREAVATAAKIAKARTERAMSMVGEVTERANSDLLPAVVEQLESERKRLKEDLANQESRLQRYGLALEAVERCAERFAST